MARLSPPAYPHRPIRRPSAGRRRCARQGCARRNRRTRRSGLRRSARTRASRTPPRGSSACRAAPGRRAGRRATGASPRSGSPPCAARGRCSATPCRPRWRSRPGPAGRRAPRGAGRARCGRDWSRRRRTTSRTADESSRGPGGTACPTRRAPPARSRRRRGPLSNGCGTRGISRRPLLLLLGLPSGADQRGPDSCMVPHQSAHRLIRVNPRRLRISGPPCRPRPARGSAPSGSRRTPSAGRRTGWCASSRQGASA